MHTTHKTEKQNLQNQKQVSSRAGSEILALFCFVPGLAHTGDGFMFLAASGSLPLIHLPL